MATGWCTSCIFPSSTMIRKRRSAWAGGTAGGGGGLGGSQETTLKWWIQFLLQYRFWSSSTFFDKHVIYYLHTDSIAMEWYSMDIMAQSHETNASSHYFALFGPQFGMAQYHLYTSKAWKHHRHHHYARGTPHFDLQAHPQAGGHLQSHTSRTETGRFNPCPWEKNTPIPLYWLVNRYPIMDDDNLQYIGLL